MGFRKNKSGQKTSSKSRNKIIRLVLLVGIIHLTTQCQPLTEPPEFDRIEKLGVSGFNGKTANLQGNAFFYNPNKRGMTLKEIDIDVFTEDRLIGEIKESLNLKIDPESEFEVPLNAKLMLGDLGIMTGILSLLGGKEIEITFEGEIGVLIYGVPRKLQIDHQEKIQL